MRVYMRHGREVRDEKGVVTTYPGNAYCDIDDATGHSWIEDGTAYEATRNNEAIIPPEPELEPEVESDPELEIEPEPEPEVEAADDSDGDEEQEG